jgi:hypothetical protein
MNHKLLCDENKGGEKDDEDDTKNDYKYKDIPDELKIRGNKHKHHFIQHCFIMYIIQKNLCIHPF